MKKLLALVLSMMMAVSLAVPAFADGPDGPAPVDGDPGFWLENGLPAPVYRPGDPIPINAILDEDLGIIGGADGPTSIIIGVPDTPDLGAIDWEGLLNYGSVEEYLKAHLDAEKKAMGGDPGQIGVMVNGRYIQFPDAAPEITGGRAMVPVRALIEALGGEVGANGPEVRCKLDGVTVTFTIGSKEAEVELGAGAKVDDEQRAGAVSLDCAPYVKDGRTYVPVRFIGEILGYAVGWDSVYETAVLTDADALAEEIDKEFTIYNRVVANVAGDYEEGKSYGADLKCDASFTVFDSLNGNATYTAGLNGKELFNSEADNADFTLTLSDNLADLLVDQMIAEGMPQEEAEPLRTALRKVELSYIMTREGLLWVHSPLLDQYGGAEDIWVGLAGDAAAAAASFDGLKGAATVGTACAALLDPNSARSWQDTAAAVQMAGAMLGDGCFTTKDGVSTMKWDVDALIAKVLEQYPEETPDVAELKELKEEISKAVKEFDFTLTVDQQGNAKLSCLVHTLPQGLGDPSIRLELDYALSTGKASMALDLHAANIGQLKLALDVTRKADGGKPAAEPPEGANVLDPAELLNP